MSRLIDADDLYERTAEWEAQALHMVEVTMNDEDQTKWRKWSTVLAERSAFKHDIADAPTIEPEQRWIPVTERLPEDEQPVIFSTKTGRVHQGKYYKDGSVNQWYSVLDKMRAWNNVVTAWMPLPEPWRGEQDGQTN